MNDDMMDGLNSLVNMADRPAGNKPVGGKPVQVQKQENSPPTSTAVGDEVLSQQILVRLDGIKAGIDDLCRVQPRQEGGAPAVQPEKPGSPTNTVPVPAERPKVPPRPAPQPAQRPEPPRSAPAVVWWPYLILVSAALELVAFALGMGYGAIVASAKFPFWYRPGVAGVLIDWVAAPAGVLLLPVMAGLLALGGAELQREGREKAAKTVWAVAGGLAVIAVLVPFIA